MTATGWVLLALGGVVCAALTLGACTPLAGGGTACPQALARVPLASDRGTISSRITRRLQR